VANLGKLKDMDSSDSGEYGNEKFKKQNVFVIGKETTEGFGQVDVGSKQ
jgi:hypothetical protein